MQTHTENRMHIKVKLHPGATMPQQAHSDDVGYDLTSAKVRIESKTCNDMLIGRVIVDTGVAVEPPEGYHVEVVPNSRICKSDYLMPNSPGIIDPGYRGTIKLVYVPRVAGMVSDARKLFAPGKVCGQLIIRKTEYLPMVQVDTLTETERGTGGFGSTEKKVTKQ